MSVFSKLKAARGLVFTLFLFFATVGSLVVLNPAPCSAGCYTDCKDECFEAYCGEFWCNDLSGYEDCKDRCREKCTGG